MATTSPLRQRMIEDMTIRNLSQATQQSYIYAVRKFSRHFGRSPDRLGIEDVRAYQLHLIAQKRSWSHINQTACALRFFYGVTLGRQEAFERIVTGRKPEKLPPVLSPEEIARLLEAVAGLRNRVALTTAYAAGLRRKTGGNLTSRGHLYCILSNPIYVGRLRHKGQIHDGLHPAIVDPETWDRAPRATHSIASAARPWTGSRPSCFREDRSSAFPHRRSKTGLAEVPRGPLVDCSDAKRTSILLLAVG